MNGNELRPLDRDAAWERLGTVRVGRLATSVGALPLVVPVQFLCLPDELLFAVPRQSTLADAIDGGIYAFEASGTVDTNRWWTVVVRGQATLVDHDHPATRHLARFELADPAVAAVGDARLVRGGEIASVAGLPELGEYLAGPT
jgi:nitroimidazol reductase NimA-like FMN-containing flavoprotein (pyridoxamine 5'-phosphate oxidase superfamily)